MSMAAMVQLFKKLSVVRSCHVKKFEVPMELSVLTIIV